MGAVKIKEGLYWVGAVDWNVRNFHGYTTHRGTTYNAYLLVDEKVVLFDTVKLHFFDQFMEHIREVLGDPRKIDYLVINHIEPDHGGAIARTVEAIQPEKIFCTRNGRLGMIGYFHREDWPFVEVKTGDSLKVGRRTIQFVETPMVHWPDSMVSYIPEEKVLISQDAFGEHYATSTRFDDDVDFCELFQEVAKYYANIVLPFSPQVQKVLQTVKDLKLEIEMICPDHGVIWRRHVKEILEAYDRWSRYEAEPRVLVIYDTMWHSTEKMAWALYEGAVSEGVEAEFFRLSVTDTTELMTEVMRAKGLAFGSSTLNNGLLPTVAGFTTYMKGLRPRNKLGLAFGSYGWSGEAVKHLNKVFEETKTEIVHEGFRVKYAPTEEDLARCRELGRLLAQKVKEACGV
ncbi:MBL fold metallo-hydrolase [Thermosulfurimonas marina]|uniref:MBL fold metallo-hydrolase n=1 Tax=Thermosulfurimonas marina TaxID=2047767 RepID=A0A6H1WUB7_9BACT|nr:flavodoxin domain-containing protein [Thermosulfurimonas marina]QJA06803.1 MBL fold metallo-hydrolase [Thermosulfurimonas marina]